MKTIKAWFVLLGLMSTFYSHAYQGQGSLSGTVTDAKTGETIPGATIQILGSPLGAVTNEQGFYRIDNIPTRTHSVQASFVGYETVVKYNVVVRSGGTPDLNFKLKEAINELGEVVVTANPFEKITETPLSIQRLSAEEIATYPGGNNDIAKVVQSLPGVAGSIGGFRNDVIIRGGAPNENVYYLDGIEIPNINHFSTQGSAGGPVGLLNVSFFEGVTLATSAFGAQYDNALSGVLQFDQRHGNSREMKTNIRVSSSETALTLEGPLLRKGKERSNTSFIISARRSYLQLLFQLIGLPILPDYWDYQYKLSHQINQYNELIITGVGSIDDFRVNELDEFDASQQASQDQVPIIRQRSNTVGINWKNRFKDGSGFTTLALSNNWLRNNFSRYNDNVNQRGLFFQNVSNELETKLRFNYTRFMGHWTLSTGTLYQRVNYDNKTQDDVNLFEYATSLNFARYGLHGQASRAFKDNRINLSFGFRMDGNSFTEKGSNLFATFSPRISGSYTFDAGRKWSVNASLGRYYKLPPYTILGFEDPAGTLVNQNARYIRSDHAVVGVEYLVAKSARITLEGFYKGYANYPVSTTKGVSLANLGAGFEVLGNEPVASVGLGRTYGLEALWQKKFDKNWYAILAYTLFWSEYTAFDKELYLPSAWDSRQLLTFTGGCKWGKNWELSARMRYLGRTPYAPVNQAATLANYPAVVLDYSRLGTVKLDAFNQTDIRIDKKWNFHRWTLDIFLEVQNFFGRQVPNVPRFGLARTDSGQIIRPQSLVQIREVDKAAVLPAIGVVIDF